MNILEPTDDYWRVVTLNNFNEMSSIEQDYYYDQLLPSDKQVFDIINNIYGLVSFGINFSSKFINLDETVKRFIVNINLDEIENKNDDNIMPFNALVCESLLGISNFVRFPAGVLNYHSINKAFYLVTNIALMMEKASFPCDYIEEFKKIDSDNKIKKIFKTIRSSGNIQSCVILDNSSIYYFNNQSENINSHKTNNTDHWRVTVSFNNQDEMTNIQIKEDEKYISTNYGLFTKSMILEEFLKLNNISKLTLNKKEIVDRIKESIIPIDTNKIKFKNYDDIYDDILNNNFSYIQSQVINYFLERLDKYCESVKLYLNNNNISCIII